MTKIQAQSNTREAISLSESNRFIELEKTIEQGKKAVFEFASALEEIRDSRLYRADFDTFEDYCKTKWDLGKAYANHLIRAVGVVKALPSNLATIVANPAQALALANLPIEIRAEVITELAESGNPITAKAISDKMPVPLEPKSEVALDCIGRKIPNGILENWKFADRDGRNTVREIGKWKQFFEKLQEKKDLVYAEVNCNSVFTDLANVWNQVKRAIPFTVCTSCNGMTHEFCNLCSKRGFISKFQWDNVVPAETKNFLIKLAKGAK